MRETSETALLHVACGTPRDGATTWVQSSAASAHCMHIHIFNKVAVRKNNECQTYEKITDS